MITRKDDNKNDYTKMQKILKEVIKGETIGSNVMENIDFEILEIVKECNIRKIH